MDKVKSLMQGGGSSSSSRRDEHDNSSDRGSSGRSKFNFDSVLNSAEPALAKKLHMLIKTEGHIVDSYENAGRERSSFASQLPEWGVTTEDDAIISLTRGLSEIFHEVAETEDNFTTQLDESRTTLKNIRNTERDVHRTRQRKNKVIEQLEEQRRKDPSSTKVRELEQEHTRLDAENIVADAQIANVTREKFKRAYDEHFAAMAERAEKQLILARAGRSMVRLLDDRAIQPGDRRQPFGDDARVKEGVQDSRNRVAAWEPTDGPGYGHGTSHTGHTAPTGTHTGTHPGSQSTVLPGQQGTQGSWQPSHGGGGHPPRQELPQSVAHGPTTSTTQPGAYSGSQSTVQPGPYPGSYASPGVIGTAHSTDYPPQAGAPGTSTSQHTSMPGTGSNLTQRPPTHGTGADPGYQPTQGTGAPSNYSSGGYADGADSRYQPVDGRAAPSNYPSGAPPTYGTATNISGDRAPTGINTTDSVGNMPTSGTFAGQTTTGAPGTETQLPVRSATDGRPL